jgi:hypothetical protein
MGARFEQKNITTRNVVTTKPTQVNLLNVINTQTFSELIHELLNILYLLKFSKFSGTINIIGFWRFNWFNFSRILGAKQMVVRKC